MSQLPNLTNSELISSLFSLSCIFVLVCLWIESNTFILLSRHMQDEQFGLMRVFYPNTKGDKRVMTKGGRV